MRLTDDDARARLTAHTHGVLSTVHPERGVDAVPVMYAVDGATSLGVPVDLVKPKASTRLQRERNLEADPRATLLVEYWDPDDWSRLWWVRAELSFDPAPADERVTALGRLLSERVPQYADRPFERVLVFDLVALTSWSAS